MLWIAQLLDRNRGTDADAGRSSPVVRETADGTGSILGNQASERQCTVLLDVVATQPSEADLVPLANPTQLAMKIRSPQVEAAENRPRTP